jgi:hypothetical protein
MTNNLSLVPAALLMIVGGAMLGWGFLEGAMAIVQWAIQQASGTSIQSAGIIGGFGLGLLLTGKALTRRTP